MAWALPDVLGSPMLAHFGAVRPLDMEALEDFGVASSVLTEYHASPNECSETGHADSVNLVWSFGIARVCGTSAHHQVLSRYSVKMLVHCQTREVRWLYEMRLPSGYSGGCDVTTLGGCDVTTLGCDVTPPANRPRLLCQMEYQ